jgi:hypothetical protein
MAPMDYHLFEKNSYHRGLVRGLASNTHSPDRMNASFCLMANKTMNADLTVSDEA